MTEQRAYDFVGQRLPSIKLDERALDERHVDFIKKRGGAREHIEFAPLRVDLKQRWTAKRKSHQVVEHARFDLDRPGLLRPRERLNVRRKDWKK